MYGQYVSPFLEIEAKGTEEREKRNRLACLSEFMA